MLCYKCLNEICGGVKGLFNHLKYIHGVHSGTSTIVVCRQDGCLATFQHLSSYRRHILAEHTNTAAGTYTMPQGTPGLESEMEQCDKMTSCTDEPHDDIDEWTGEDELFESVSYFIASMRASSMPYSSIQKVILEVEELIKVVVDHMHKRFQLTMQEVQRNMQLGEVDVNKLEKVFDEYELVQKTFNGLRSQHNQDKYFREKGYLVSPEEKVLGQSFVSQSDSSSGGVCQTLKNDTFQYIPITKTIKKHLEQPGIMTAILNQQPSQDDCLLRTHLDGSYFKNKFSAENNVVIPILLYCDDYETGNPLGSKKGTHKLAGFYISLLCLPLQFQASLSNILLAACGKRTEIAKYGIDRILSAIVKDLEEMQEQGLEISCEEYTGSVKPVLFQAIGDNLGLHEVLGFVGSFSANFPCRFCKAPKETTRTQLVEDVALLRTKDSVDADILVNNVSETGIRRSSELNKLTGFHVSENSAVDIMHDFLEGLIPLEMKLTLKVLIEEGCFTLGIVNNRLSSFSYGFVDKKNKPSPIQQSAISNPWGSSGQKAAQMKCLALYLPLIIGDLISEESDVWEMFLLLLDIYKIVVAPSISNAGTYVLKALIRDHHQLYLELFPESHLIPKHHFVLHYPRLTRLLGPLAQYSSMRKEAKHKPLKRWARVCNNYKNIAKTVTDRHQQQQSCNFLLRKPLQCDTEIRDQVPTQVSSLDEAVDVCASLGCNMEDVVTLSGSVCIQTYEYKPNCMVLVDWDDDGPQYAKVNHIMEIHNSIYFVLHMWQTRYYNRHLHAYAVLESKELKCIIIKRPQDLRASRPFHVTKCHNKDDLSWYIITPFNIV